MTLGRSFLNLGVLVASAAILGACGGGPVGVETSTQAEEPSCGRHCPETCWVEIRAAGSGKEAWLWIFDASQIDPESALVDGSFLLTNGSDSFNPDLEPVLDDPIPSTVEAIWMLPSTFDTSGSLSAKVILDGLDDLDCEL